ncbi:zf-HC2 domain-containing protein [Actinosynnema sp. NPDC047251]|uniref:Transmembrane anti-sigma factor n=1 Tax=Saccharothrix espanaensis (strain ATCC 51144 / DSM 44229 / JCM 9112 / NBRC 15066 / NRRL 15764) TaxID=1179773 RepID=K0K0G1_SACES|nr:zf-HC2 domain-containing protein [Saccharothrix espanaensis]CCH33735.1 Transmembrane anti-sigma factor [Saccharothrix espanaensis DSM 44229]
MTTNHDPQLLGAYVLGVLDEPEVRAVEEHVAACPRCRTEVDELRAVEEAMGEVPPEMLLDGPPEGGDLLLRRALRQVRDERGGEVRRRRLGLGVAAAVVAAVVLGGGFAVGRSTAPTDQVAGSTPPTVVTDAKVGTAVDPATGARMTVQVKPAAGWVRLNVSAAGIAKNRKCKLFVVAKDGTSHEAGSWLVSALGEKEGTNLDGSALVAPADVAAVEIRDFDGERIVSVRV